MDSLSEIPAPHAGILTNKKSTTMAKEAGEYTRKNIDIKTTSVKKLKIEAAHKDTTVKELIEKIIEDYCNPPADSKTKKH